MIVNNQITKDVGVEKIKNCNPWESFGSLYRDKKADVYMYPCEAGIRVYLEGCWLVDVVVVVDSTCIWSDVDMVVCSVVFKKRFHETLGGWGWAFERWWCFKNNKMKKKVPWSRSKLILQFDWWIHNRISPSHHQKAISPNPVSKNEKNNTTQIPTIIIANNRAHCSNEKTHRWSPKRPYPPISQPTNKCYCYFLLSR